MHDDVRHRSLIDLNRAGTCLAEIVTYPDMRSIAEAQSFLFKLQTLLRTLGVCDANMEEGSMRCDANISIRPKNDHALGTRCEIKNLNSLKHLSFALGRTIDLIEEKKIIYLKF